MRISNLKVTEGAPLEVAKGRVFDRILRKGDFTPFSVAGPELADCAYLITTGDSPHMPSQIDRLVQYSNKVVVLRTLTHHESDENFDDVEFVSFQGPLQDKFLHLRSSINPTLRWNKQFDIPTKRTFAIDHAKTNGYETILLVDDDILFQDTFVSSALHLLRQGTDIACAYCLNYPDISTLDRVYCSLTGEVPEVTIGGNALVLKVGPKLGIFPYVYNEDWLFLWTSMRYGGATITPFQEVVQRPPRDGRNSLVQMEQFGELIVSALFYHKEEKVELSLLTDHEFVCDCLHTYRKSILELQTYGKYTSMIVTALSAIDEITSRDVCSFAENFLRELDNHYEHSISV